MLYMVEMDFPHPDRVEPWQAWYAGHVGMLLTLPGFRAAQRFRAETATPSPWLAVYAVEPGALDSAAYRAKAGPASTGAWRALMTNWRRNLVEGLEELPEVAADQRLVVIDRAGEGAPALPAGFVGLRPVGLDRTIGERGVRLLGAGEPLPADAAAAGAVTFRPITGRLAGSGANRPGP